MTTASTDNPSQGKASGVLIYIIVACLLLGLYVGGFFLYRQTHFVRVRRTSLIFVDYAPDPFGNIAFWFFRPLSYIDYEITETEHMQATP